MATAPTVRHHIKEATNEATAVGLKILLDVTVEEDTHLATYVACACGGGGGGCSGGHPPKN